MKIMRGEFLDVGNGWFFAIDEEWTTSLGECPVGFIGDSRSSNPNEFYGPAAWKRKVGPISARTLLVVGEEPSEGLVHPYPFPGPVAVTDAGRDAGLADLHDRCFEDLDALLGHPIFGASIGRVLVASDEARLVSIRSQHEHEFGMSPNT